MEEASVMDNFGAGATQGGQAAVEQATAIRVVVRCRPVLPNEAEAGKRMTSLTLNPAEGSVSLLPKCEKDVVEGGDKTTTTTTMGGAVRDFGFDAVLGPDASQAQAIEAVDLRRMLQASLDGYHATIFAYGQTGSGKTHTMEGFEYTTGGAGGGENPPKAKLDDTPPEHLGVIPAAAVMLFAAVDAAKKTGRRVDVAVTYVQIYKEVCHDLLLDKSNGASNSTAAFAGPVRGKMPGLRMRWSKPLGFHLEGVRMIPVSGPDELMSLFKSGVRNKVMASHRLNMASSRSHAILTVHVTASTPDDPTEVTRAKVSLVDLAGSERQTATGVGGEMLREAISINKSLFTLRKVITSLAESRYKGLHVPYRDSKLTSLLQDSLGGTSLTVMVACLSPCDVHFDENLSTLEYASRASCISNRVAVNEDPKSRLIRELRAQNAFLTAQLAHMRAAGYELPAALDGFDLEEESRRLQRGAEKMSGENAAVAAAKHRSDHGGISMGLKPNLAGATAGAFAAGGGGGGVQSRRGAGSAASDAPKVSSAAKFAPEDAAAVSAADAAMRTAEAAGGGGGGGGGGHTKEVLESMRLIREQVRQLAAANTSLRQEHSTAVNRAEELEDERDALMQEITEVRDKNSFLESLVAMDDGEDGGAGGGMTGNISALTSAGGGSSAAHTANRAALLELLDLREECRTLKERLGRWELEGSGGGGGGGTTAGGMSRRSGSGLGRTGGSLAASGARGGSGGAGRSASGPPRAGNVANLVRTSSSGGGTRPRTPSAAAAAASHLPRSSSGGSSSARFATSLPSSSSSASSSFNVNVVDGGGNSRFPRRAMLSVADLKNAIALGEVPQTKPSQTPKGGGGGGGNGGFNSVFNPPPGGSVGGGSSLRVTSAGRMIGESATVSGSGAGASSSNKTGLAEALDPIMSDPEAALAELMRSRQALVRDHLANPKP